MIEDWHHMTNPQKAEFLGALFLFVVTGIIMGSLYLGWLEESDRRHKQVLACMHEMTPCEHARCVSVVEDVPMSQELSDACP